jgi:hypothetical protein
MNRRPEDGEPWQALQRATSAVQGSATSTTREPQDAGAALREPPRESGRRLGTLARPGRYGKPAEELRITADAFEGHDFIGTRIWTQGRDGIFYPSQRGITIRRAEIADFIKAMVAGARALGIGEKGGRDA